MTSNLRPIQIRALVDQNGGAITTTNPFPVGIYDSYAKEPIDSMTSSFKTTTYEHHEIHNGSHYNICGFQTLASIGATIGFGVTTPNTLTQAHMTINIEGNIGGFDFRVHENPTFTGGTALTPRNNNRNFADASKLTVVGNPTLVATGTIIDLARHGSSGLAGRGGGSATGERQNEMVLKTNTKYYYEMATLANSNTITYCGSWYEHTGLV